MRARVTIALEVDRGGHAVVVRGLGAGPLAAIDSGDWTRHRLRVHVADDAACEDLPATSGRCEVLGDSLRFIPRFPFVPGLAYRAVFESGTRRRPDAASSRTFEFALPCEAWVDANRVTGIFPSADRLPENLLRFHVGFAHSMRRGDADEAIALLDANGSPVPDVLYRPPVELWDRGMRHLTVLLDPGRLKRRVGPNRALGPPLAVGRHYTLRIGAAMTDGAGRGLDAAVEKRFQVSAAVREAIRIDRWSLTRPAAATRDALVLDVPHPLDRASLAQAIAVDASDGSPLAGRIAIDRDETRWRFTPSTRWEAGRYLIRIASDLEDVCGNRPGSAFDRPLANVTTPPPAVAERSIAFSLS